MTCRNFQYEVGKEYETDKAKACEAGFHFCENPFAVWTYYPPCGENGRLNRFCEVEGSGETDCSKPDKTACSHIRIGVEIGLQGIINAGVKFMTDKSAGDGKKESNTGDRSAASVEGKESIAIVTGKDSKAKGSLGCWIILTERGEWDGDTYPILDVKSFKVDGEAIKADTWYKLIDGKAVEVE